MNYAWSQGQPQSISVVSGGTTKTLLDQITVSPFGPIKSWVWQFGATSSPHTRTYDTNGRLVRHPLGNLVRDIIYDDADRISHYTHYAADTAQAATAYDQAFSYDELNRLTSVTASTNWSYSYDATGNRTASASGIAARGYTVQANSNRLDALANPARSMLYDAAGNTSSDTQSGASSNYTAVYSLEARLAQMDQGSAGVAFAYDALGRRASRTPLGTAAGQIVTGTTGNDTIVGTAGDDLIDGGGGRDSLTGNGGRNQYVFRGNFNGGTTIFDFKPGLDTLVVTEFLAANGVASNAPFAEGYMTCTRSGIADSMLWVDFDRAGPGARRPAILLKGVMCSAIDDSIWGDGISRDGSTSYVYDQGHHLIGEYHADGTPISEYVWFGDTPVALLQPSGAGVQIYAIHADHLDTPRVVLDAQGSVRWRWMGEPFGASPAEEIPTAGKATLRLNLRFPGQQFEAFGGRHYNYFRDYDPTIGRYVQSDPIGLAGGINTYSYAEGNPLSLADPDGLNPAAVCRAFSFGFRVGEEIIEPAVRPYVTAGVEWVFGDPLKAVPKPQQSTAPHEAANRRQRQYEAAKARCTPPNPEPGASCSDISKMIDMLQNSIDRYEYFDRTYAPGRHTQKITEVRNRIDALKERYKKDCEECKK